MARKRSTNVGEKSGKGFKVSKTKFCVSFTGNFRRVLKGMKNRFPGHFKTLFKDFHDKKGNVIERYLTCTKDLEAQINKVIETRKRHVGGACGA